MFCSLDRLAVVPSGLQGPGAAVLVSTNALQLTPGLFKDNVLSSHCFLMKVIFLLLSEPHDLVLSLGPLIPECSHVRIIVDV